MQPTILTTEMFNKQASALTNYVKSQYGVEIKAAVKDIKNIDESLRNLKSFIEKIL